MDRSTGPTGSDTKHEDAVRNTLSWAEEAAASGDYAGAVAWLDTISAIGDSLPPSYRTKRAAWMAAATDGSQA